MLTTRLAWAVIVLLATYLAFLGGGWLGIYSAELRMVSVALAGIALAAWFVLASRRPSWRPQSVLWPAIAAALASLAISTVFSRVPRISLEYLGYAVVLAALYLLLVRLMAHPFFQRRLLALGGMFFAVVSIAFLGLVFKHWIDWWQLLGHFAVPPLRPNFEGLTYNNPSAVLTAAALFAVPAIALVDPGARRGKVAIVAMLVLLGVVAFLTGSRAGWLAIALTIVVGAVAAAFDSGVRSSVRRAARGVLRDRTMKIAAAVVVVVGLVALALFTPAIVRRISEGGEEARAQYAVTAIRMFLSSPLVGTGPGTWVIQRMAQTSEDEVDYVIPHAHNLEVQTLAEQGVIGAAAGAVVLAALALLVTRAMRHSDPMRRRMGWITFLGLVYFGAHQLLDFYANMPAVLFAAAIPVAYLDATARPPANARVPRWRLRPAISRLLAPAAGVAVLAIVGGLLLSELPAMQNEHAVELANDGHWSEADGPARVAADADPVIGSYALTAGITASRAGDHALALSYFRQVAERDDLPEAWVDLAAEQLTLGQPADARTSLDRAFRLGRQRAGLAIAIADLALRAADASLAAEAATIVLLQQPLTASDPWWSATRDRASLLASVRANLVLSAPDAVRWQLAMAAGEQTSAMTSGARLPDAAFIGLVINAWRGEAEDLERLRADCYASPLDLVRLIWCGTVASRSDNERWAADMRRLLDGLGASSAYAGSVVISDAPGPIDTLTGSTIPYWGVFTYRRPVPGDMIVPGVAHLVVQ